MHFKYSQIKWVEYVLLHLNVFIKIKVNDFRKALQNSRSNKFLQKTFLVNEVGYLPRKIIPEMKKFFKDPIYNLYVTPSRIGLCSKDI